jgi:hypothetical protein
MDFEAIAFADYATRASGCVTQCIQRVQAVTYSDERIDEVLDLLRGGMSKLAVSRLTGISRSAILDWTEGRRPIPRESRDGFAYGYARCVVTTWTHYHLALTRISSAYIWGTDA